MYIHIYCVQNKIKNFFRSKYAVKRETNRLKVPYYVKNNFHAEYQGSVGRLEESVEEDYIDHLKYSCSRERNYRK